MSANAIDLAVNPLDRGNGLPAPRVAHYVLAGPALSRILVRYWRVELARPLAARRLALDAVRFRTRSGTTTTASLLPFALGDVDESIVFGATTAYVIESRLSGESLLLRASTATDWIRRRLALNCAAVFAALLSIEDDRVQALLLPLRHTLDADEVESVQKRQSRNAGASNRAFLQEWRSLLSTA